MLKKHGISKWKSVIYPPPPFHLLHKKKKNGTLFLFLENGGLALFDLYREHAVGVGDRFTYNRLKWNDCKKCF